MKYVFYFFLLSVGIASASEALEFSTPKIAESGLWIGSVGDQQVLACLGFSSQGKLLKSSSYLYVRHAKPIALHQKEGMEGTWEEIVGDATTGFWQLHKVNEREIEASWQGIEQKKFVPVSLLRFEDLDGTQNECFAENALYNARAIKKFNAMKTEGASILQFSGKKYQVLNLKKTNISSLEIVENISARAAINLRLRNQLQTNAAAYFECVNPDQLGAHTNADDRNSDLTVVVEPVFWNDRWLSLVSRTAGDCGGAYPHFSFTYTTWDTQTGEKVDLWRWLDFDRVKKFVVKNSSQHRTQEVRRELNTLIVKKAIRARRAINGKGADKNNCIAEIRGNSDYQLHLSKSGIVFSQDFPHVIQACNGDVELDYSELLPYLSEQGRQYLSLLQKDMQ